MNQWRLYRRMERSGMYSRTSNQFLATSCNKRCAMCVCVRVCQRFPRVHPEPRDPGQIIERERDCTGDCTTYTRGRDSWIYNPFPYSIRQGVGLPCFHKACFLLVLAQAASMRQTSPLGQAQKVSQRRQILRIGEGTSTWRKRNTTTHLHDHENYHQQVTASAPEHHATSDSSKQWRQWQWPHQ